MTLPPAVAACRRGVRRALAGLEPGDRVVVACSGGADSLALLAAAVHEARDLAVHVIGATVDHGLQDGSAERAEQVVAAMASLGADETLSARVRVEGGGQGPEAAARQARYAVLEEVAERTGARRVLLAHTLDDQAETVLLGLTRGSGGRSIAGMRPAYDVFVRPLLDVRRSGTEAACRAEGIAWWDDPQNDDPRFTRNRVRREVLPVLERELGPGVAETLARTAAQLRPDMEALDRMAEEQHARLRTDEGLPLSRLRDLDEAVASRVLRLAAVAAGARPSELFHVHVRALVDLAAGEVTGQVQLPGHVTAVREAGHLRFRRTAVES
ncbi:tRNA lysidine(34) synthetase TilS [Nocardioides sp. GXQ0305]|uniref:tRNA lysidine(34) synthetase TilS n=1 Tax=Nocardioides sp. GXQ0305 TaxID=3423912 RepID=UPI003D7D3151